VAARFVQKQKQHSLSTENCAKLLIINSLSVSTSSLPEDFIFSIFVCFYCFPSYYLHMAERLLLYNFSETTQIKVGSAYIYRWIFVKGHRNIFLLYHYIFVSCLWDYVIMFFDFSQIKSRKSTNRQNKIGTHISNDVSNFIILTDRQY